MARGIAAIRRLRSHDSCETKTLRGSSIDKQQRRIDPEFVPGQPAQPLNVKGRSHIGVLPNAEDMLCPKNENVPAMRFDEVIAEFVHKHLIARIHCTSGNDLTTTIGAAWKNVEIVAEGIGRCVNEIILLLADQSRQREEKEDFFLLDSNNLIILSRDNIDIIAA